MSLAVSLYRWRLDLVARGAFRFRIVPQIHTYVPVFIGIFFFSVFTLQTPCTRVYVRTLVGSNVSNLVKDGIILDNVTRGHRDVFATSRCGILWILGS